MGHTIRQLTPDEPAHWYATLAAQHGLNGAGGIYFTASAAPPEATPEQLASARAGLERGVDEPKWLRVFGVWRDGRMVGHADLKGGAYPSEMHRCTLGIGLERPHQGQGLGARLLDEAVTWARGAGLAWVDLGVFEGNGPALALYRKGGFRELGRLPDRHRVAGASLTEVMMSLAL